MSSRLTWIIATAVVAWPIAATADPIRIIYDSRNAAAQVTLDDPNGTHRNNHNNACCDSNLTARAGTHSDGGSGSASATLNNDVSNLSHIAGSGSGRATLQTSGSGIATGFSQFYMGFELDSPQTFSFTGVFTSSGDQREGGSTGGFGSWDAALKTDREVFVFDHRSTESGSVFETGLLSAGRWYLYVASGGAVLVPQWGTVARGGSGAASFRFTLDFAREATQTPEPGSMLLIAGGLIGLVRARRREVSTE